MNPFITRETLEQAGIDLTNKDIDALLEHLNQTLEERVGAEVVASLDDDKLQELSDLQERGSDEQLVGWMTTNVPQLGEITQDEIDILIGELAENSDGINQAA
ncbi:MAG: DUF5663 domain-containing protein [Candidatus Saccharimonadales bacterium]